MRLRTSFAIFVCVLLACITTGAQNRSNIRTKRILTCENFCYGLILTGRLIDTLEFSNCDAISGMTCHIILKRGAQLPSRIFMQAMDSRNQPLGTRHLLIYPELKDGEGGSATFLRIPEGTRSVVLAGEWNGPYRNPY
jgi:hypothetical protein